MGTVGGGRGALQACRSLRTFDPKMELDRVSHGLPSTRAARMINCSYRWVRVFELLQAESLH